MKCPELLAPAGSPEALRSAVLAGADAVYFGTTLFNARMMAKNFTRNDTLEAISFCHERGVNCHITMNTAVTDRQMKDALLQVEFLYKSGADALIVADLGLSAEIHKYFPDLELHASTQCSGHNIEAAKFLAEKGFSRMVAARELDRENLKTLVKGSPIETEIFVHGAHCVSQSGQCLFSSFLGGRSGNRGECAQPCRMVYNSGYPLSLKDLSLANHITELSDMGVRSLKIEGRMKSSDYVKEVVSVYRTLLDEMRDATADELKYLAEVFSRSGFTDGYFTKNINKAMLGVRTGKDIEATKALFSKKGEENRVSFEACAKKAAAVPERTNTLPCEKIPTPKKENGIKPRVSARFYDAKTIPEDVYSRGVDIVYLPLDRFQKGLANGIVLPPVIFDSETDKVKRSLALARENGAEYALVGNVGHISLAKSEGFRLVGDYRLNIFSSYTAEVFSEYFEELFLSPELILPQIRDIHFPKSVIIYGRQPLMTLERTTGLSSLTDRTKATFPILTEGGREIVFNSVPTYMADKEADLMKAGEFSKHYIFSVEGKRETEMIFDSYKKGWTTKKSVRRIK